MVVAGNCVIMETNDKVAAMERLMKWPVGASSPSRLVCAFKNGVVIKDPHGINANFNKYWRDAEDIKRMMEICQGFQQANVMSLEDWTTRTFEDPELAKAVEAAAKEAEKAEMDAAAKEAEKAEMDAAATKLQAMYRGKVVRNNVKTSRRRPSVILVTPQAIYTMPIPSTHGSEPTWLPEMPQLNISKWGMAGTHRVRPASGAPSARPGSPRSARRRRDKSAEPAAEPVSRPPGSPKLRPATSPAQQPGVAGEALMPPINSLGDLCNVLVQRRGSLLRAWRLDLDITGTGFASKEDFQNMCINYGVEEACERLWDQLPNPAVTRIIFADFAPSEAANVLDFFVALYNKKYSLEEIWQVVNTNTKWFAKSEDFFRGCSARLGFRGDAPLLYAGLDVSGQGRLWYEDFEYLGVLFESCNGKLNLPAAGQYLTKKALHRPRKDPTRNESDIEAGAEFARFTMNNWRSIVDLFQEHENVATAKRQYRPVKAFDFVRWMRAVGFFGDAQAVVREVHREFKMHGHHFGALARDARPRDVDPDLISLPQVQCFRRCRGAICLKRLVATMKVRRGFGSVLRCWRLDYDKDGHGFVTKAQFESTCNVLGCEPDMGILWAVLRPDGDLDPLELWDFSVGEAADLHQFGSLLLNRALWDINQAWRLLDPRRIGSTDYHQFKLTCQELGFTGDPVRLFRGLDSSGKGEVWLDLLDPAWVMVLTNALPSKQADRRRARLARLAVDEDTQPVKLDLELFLRRLCLDKPGSSRLPDREYMTRLESLGYEGIVSRKAGQLVRNLARRRDIAEGLVQPSGQQGERPPWDDSDVVRKPRPFPLKYSEYHPTLGTRLFAHLIKPLDQT